MVARKTKLISIYLILAIFAVGYPSPGVSNELMRAEIGVEIFSSEYSFQANNPDQFKAGDKLRIYLRPQKDSFVYIISSTGENAMWLNPGKSDRFVKNGSIRAFPSFKKFYHPDKSLRHISFTIICSLQKIPEIENLLSPGPAPQSSWSVIERKLRGKSKIFLHEKFRKPLEMAGSVRGLRSQSVLKNLSKFSGNLLLIQRYDFDVKK